VTIDGGIDLVLESVKSIKKVEKEASESIEKARIDAESIIEDATKKAEGMIKVAESDSNSMVGEMLNQYEKEATIEASEIIDKSEKGVKKLIDEARGKIDTATELVVAKLIGD